MNFLRKLVKNETKAEETREEIKEEVEDDYETDSEKETDELMMNYIVKDSNTKLTPKLEYCLFKMNGLHTLDFWELQRKIDPEKIESMFAKMLVFFDENGYFPFTDPIHIARASYEENTFYVLDGQHRLKVYEKISDLRDRKMYERFPMYIHTVNTEKELIEQFDRVNDRMPINHRALMQYKIKDIITGLEKEFKTGIYGVNRPFLNKVKFIEKLRENRDSIELHNAQVIVSKLMKINAEIRRMNRTKRGRVSSNTHDRAEDMNFFLGYDKDMAWIEKL